jgi:aminoglycoside phosphotransferase (APT) family kinase protein
VLLWHHPRMDPLGSSLSPLPGGQSGQTFLAEAAGERTVLRVYARPGNRGAAAHEVDAALLRLLRGLFPVPEVLEVRRAAGDMPALLVTEFLPGERLDLLLPSLDAEARAHVGEALGRLLGRLAAVPMLTAGVFVDSNLRIDAFAPGDDDLTAWIDQHELDLTPGETAGLDQLATGAQARLDGVRRHALVHGDLVPENVLVDPETLQVTGLVDWEVAYAGSPYADLGRLVRWADPVLASAAIAAYCDGLGEDPALVRELAMGADLFALVELAARHPHDPRAAAARSALLERTRQD